VGFHLCQLFEMGKKLVEFGLDAFAHAAQQHGQQRGRRQFSVAGEGIGKLGCRATSRNWLECR